jgi:hypothetical protein
VAAQIGKFRCRRSGRSLRLVVIGAGALGLLARKRPISDQALCALETCSCHRELGLRLGIAGAKVSLDEVERIVI